MAAPVPMVPLLSGPPLCWAAPAQAAVPNVPQEDPTVPNEPPLTRPLLNCVEKAPGCEAARAEPMVPTVPAVPQTEPTEPPVPAVPPLDGCWSPPNDPTAAAMPPIPLLVALPISLDGC